MIPAFSPDGFLPLGLHSASLLEVEARFGGNATRGEQLDLLRQVVNAAKSYSSIKRVLLWGSFVSIEAEPNDLDYSLVVGVEHRLVSIRPEHERFLAPKAARLAYGVDPNYLLIADYDLERYLTSVAGLRVGSEAR